MPGNSFSQDLSTYGWSRAISHTSAALYNFGVTSGQYSTRVLALFIALRAPPTPYMQADGRADEAERIAQLVQDEAGVREMKCGCDVGKEDKRRRRHTRLCRVEYADVPPARARRRMRGRHRLQEFVELGRRHTFPPRLGHPVDRLEHFAGSLSGGG